MKTSKLLITSLLAAAAMSAVPAWADDVSGDVAVSADNSTVYAMTGDTTFTFTNSPTLTGSISGAYTLTTSGDATLATGFGGTGDTRWTAGNLVVGSGTLTWGQGSTTDPATANQMKALGETISVSSGANLKIHLWTGKDLDTSTDGKVNITSKIILNGTSTLETADGSYYFSEGIQVGDGTNAGTGTFKANWDKAIVISSLSGSGTMNFVGANTAYGAPLFSLGGNGGFSGALNVTSTSLHLTSENAASGATLNIAGGASLYLDATTNNVKGLSGSGSVVAATAGNTLAIATETGVTNTFSGTVGTSTSAVGLSVSGSGTQAFTGTSYFSTVSVADTAALDLSGGNITLASAIDNAGSVTFSSGSVVEIGALGGTIFNTAQSGRLAVSETFTIATGTGSVSGLTASGIRVNGFTYASMTVADDCKSVAVDSAVYNIASGSTATISEVTNAGTVDFINVLGTLTGLGSTFTTTPIYGTGAVSVDTGLLEYHDKTFLETFEGILNISGTGEVRLGNAGSTKLTKVSKVTVSTGGTLSFWAGTFSRAVELSGGTLKSGGGDIGFSGSVTVASASTIDTSNDTNSNGNTITLSGAVTGTGTLTKQGAGTLVFDNNTLSLGELVVSAGTVQVKNSAATSGSGKTLTKVTLATGRTLTLYSGAQPTVATTIGELALSGETATLETTNYQGYWKVNKLSIGEQTSATLNLTSSHSADLISIFEFGSEGAVDVGNFAGRLNVTSTNGGNYRSVSVVLSNGDIAKNAVVNLASIGSSDSSTTPSRLSLGVNADRVTIAGLVSTLGDKAGVYSGKVGTKTTGNGLPASDSTVRTLVINTADNYSFNGTILANLNLEKTGAGTQTLAGASAAFNGSVTISQGVLALADAAAIGTGNTVRIVGGQLKVGNGTTAVSLNAAAYTIVLSNAYSETSGTGVAAIVGTDTTNKSSVALATDTKITIELADSVAVSLAAEAAQYQYKIFDVTTIAADSFSVDDFVLAEALQGTWQISDYANGVLTLTVPEPSVFGLLAGAGALALAGTRRRRKKA